MQHQESHWGVTVVSLRHRLRHVVVLELLRRVWLVSGSPHQSSTLSTGFFFFCLFFCSMIEFLLVEFYCSEQITQATVSFILLLDSVHKWFITSCHRLLIGSLAYAVIWGHHPRILELNPTDRRPADCGGGKGLRFDSGNISQLTNADSSDSDLNPGIIND